MNKTGYFTHTDCWKHEMGPGHPECPERLDAIEERLRLSGLGALLDRREAPLAAIGDIELAHDRMMVAATRGLSEQLADDILAGGPQYAQIDPDTALNVHTWNAALRAAGAVIAATDSVMAGEMSNAFCAVRPPGHHAERGKAMGFCFFSNIAIAAKYALARHGLKRVAIVDFDVHHGNGTANIIHFAEIFDNFQDGVLTADCLMMCGNAVEPSIQYTFNVGRRGMTIETVMVSQPDATEQWQKAMVDAKGRDWVINASFNCDHSFDRVGKGLFRPAQATRIVVWASPPRFACDGPRPI